MHLDTKLLNKTIINVDQIYYLSCKRLSVSASVFRREQNYFVQINVPKYVLFYNKPVGNSLISTEIK